MTPLTPAGQALLDRWFTHGGLASEEASREILESERQAADRALAELRREVERSRPDPTSMEGGTFQMGYRSGFASGMDWCAALIDKASKPEEGL